MPNARLTTATSSSSVHAIGLHSHSFENSNRYAAALVVPERPLKVD